MNNPVGIAIITALASILVAVISLIFPIYKYFQDKRKEDRNKRFKNYHRLLNDLLGVEGKKLMVDRQIAIIFELRNFPEYYPVTLRILSGIREDLGDENKNPRLHRFFNEISLTEQYIKASSPQ